MQKLVMWTLMLFIAGCGDIKVVPDKPFEKKSVVHHQYNKSYELGKKRTAYIGEPIVKWHHIYIKNDVVGERYSASSDFTLTGRYLKRGFMPNNVDIKGSAKNSYYSIGSTEYNDIEYAVLGHAEDEDDNDFYLLIDKEGKINKNILIDENKDRKLLPSESPSLTPEHVSFVKVPVETGRITDGTTHELVFGGVNDITLNVTYREYSPDNHARQAFFQNVVYQTNADTIRFRDVKIQIHEVTNEKIIYTILEDNLDETVQ